MEKNTKIQICIYCYFIVQYIQTKFLKNPLQFHGCIYNMMIANHHHYDHHKHHYDYYHYYHLGNVIYNNVMKKRLGSKKYGAVGIHKKKAIRFFSFLKTTVIYTCIHHSSNNIFMVKSSHNSNCRFARPFIRSFNSIV